MSHVIEEFTAQVPVWRPYLRPVVLEEATPAQRDALKETPSHTKVSDYVLVLAHDPETLSVRTPLFNRIMYDRGGLSRAERELGAVGSSIVNRCIYCAAVHADRYNQLTRDESAMQAVFAAGADADLEPRARAILQFAAGLAQCPPEADTAPLRAAGLDDAEMVDLVLSTALFGWANRLMHTLGEPVAKDAP